MFKQFKRGCLITIVIYLFFLSRNSQMSPIPSISPVSEEDFATPAQQENLVKRLLPPCNSNPLLASAKNLLKGRAWEVWGLLGE